MKRSSIIVIAVVVIVLIGGILLLKKHYSTSANPAPMPVETKETQAALSPEEETQILAASDEIVKANTEKGYTYTLSIKKHVKDYVRVDVTSGAGEMIDPAQVILEKQSGVWKALMFGTSFPDMYDKVPTLFE